MNLDNLITAFDNSLRTVFAPAGANPASDLPEAGLSESEKREAEALMRVNHVGMSPVNGRWIGQPAKAGLSPVQQMA